MTRTELLLSIEQIIHQLNEQQKRLQSFPSEIPALESDLLLRQIRQLYEYALQLEKAGSGSTAPAQRVPAIEAQTESTTEQASAKEPKHESLTEHILIDAAIQQQVQTDVAPAAGVTPRKIKGDVNTVLFKDSPTVGDRFEDEPSLHARIASSNTKSSVASHLQRKPIVDLTKAIGLNEKFLFINHLFDGNLQVYNQAIEYLNTCKGKDVALEYIHNTLIPQFNWDLKSNPCVLFFELVERRFL